MKIKRCKRVTSGSAIDTADKEDRSPNITSLAAYQMLLENAEDNNKELREEIKKLEELVDSYATVARTVRLQLASFCDTNLPYDKMIADASRRASAEIERLQADCFSLENERDTYKEILEREVTHFIKTYRSKVDLYLHGKAIPLYVKDALDRVEKEMAGDENA